MLSPTGKKLREFIKSELKRKDLNYTELAEKLSVSLPTVTRILNSEDIGLERLIKISQVLEMNIEELFEKYSKTQSQPDHLNEDQEQFLVENPKYLYLIILLNTRGSIEQVKKDYGAGAKELYSALRSIEDMGFIEIKSPKKINLKIQVPFQISNTGRVKKTLVETFKKETIENAKNVEPGFSPKKDSYLASFEMYLTEENLKALNQELYELWERYQRRSKIDCQRYCFPEIQPMVGLFYTQKNDLWKKIVMEGVFESLP